MNEIVVTNRIEEIDSNSMIVDENSSVFAGKDDIPVAGECISPIAFDVPCTNFVDDNEYIPDDFDNSIVVDGTSEHVIVEESAIPDNEELLGLSVGSIEDAFGKYNDYAFRMGFSARKGKKYYVTGTRILKTKVFCCSKSGFRIIPDNPNKCYSKIVTRSGCNAMCQFDIDSNGKWVVTKHVKEHNHELCLASSSYMLRSHRKVSENQLTCLKNMKRSGVPLSDGIRFLKCQSGGSLFVGFTPRDAYNMISSDSAKHLDGTDSNSLIEIFRRRQMDESDFYFEFELDEDARLCNFFWRDGQMKADYDLFGDLVVHDTTYRTNRYDMICAPFVGMNHHCMNVMFGCGFLLNERIESFVWLFKVFVRSMGGKHPQTIMIDQCAAMAAGIAQVFSNSNHRLCIWHIGENSKKHIKSLRNKKGFLELFNFLLKYTDTEAEFEFYWTRMMIEYGCYKNVWLNKLYSIREKWCPAFSKEYFSGGILSSQRSESTNHSISRRLSKTAGLCDFYNSFVSVVSEWRSRENGENVRCSQGLAPMVMNHVKLLSHARDIYTIEIYYLFEEQFLKGTSCHQESVGGSGNEIKYHVWRPDVDLIRHEVCFKVNDLDISCSCMLFSEMGILCSHSLRIFNVHCVAAIPDKYIIKRWTKKGIEDRIISSDSSLNILSIASSVWVIQMGRKFQQLVLSSQVNCKAREVCENAFEDARRKVEGDIGPIVIEDGEERIAGVIQNPARNRTKGERNRRHISTIEKKYNQVRGRKLGVKVAEMSTKAAVQASVEGVVANIVGSGYFVHPSSGSHELGLVKSS
ncbi:PREDICTED: protein FAR1-RELATED SEQUENCE 5-like [Ipomoea nil]|uniref:protein FAR1-RELATED SEQUENCE 5-like n=1 Tax=Ipomoea nil TaxID=35883 RepID=UPI000901A428|nr:PREDICTED: protein FAR1-RELATED SEQUENCE 5-like [Ipomoea nil]